MKTHPTKEELLKSVYADTHQAASLVSKAWTDGQFTVAGAEEMKRMLTRANSAMTTLDWVLRGGSMPKIGD